MSAALFDNCKAKKATQLALLVEIEGETLWIPKSVIHADSEVFDINENSEGMLALEEWWAEKAGLV